MALMSSRSWPDWVNHYAKSHQHPANRLCHTIGIPLIVLSMLLFAAGFVLRSLWLPALALFGTGWAFQFVGHAYEGKPPEFLQDWRFLLVGVRWWMAKVRGKV
jgi:uncharacterized membrane protein YGL010W